MLTALFILTSALAFDHSHADLGAFLDGAVGAATVDYGALAKRSGKLDGYLKSIAEADDSKFSDAEKLALNVNAYNAYTLRTVLDALPLDSIMELDGGKVWDKRKFEVAGSDLTLNQMEHERVRKLADGRVHAVLNCAAKGCPPLREAPFLPIETEKQLNAAAAGWAATNAYRIEGSTIGLSQLFDWYADDFKSANKGDIPGLEGKAENAVWFLIPHLPDADAERLKKGDLSVVWVEYDWALNRK